MSANTPVAAAATLEVLSLRDRVAALEQLLDGERKLHDDTMEKWKATIQTMERMNALAGGHSPERDRIATERNALEVAVAMKDLRIAELERAVGELTLRLQARAA